MKNPLSIQTFPAASTPVFFQTGMHLTTFGSQLQVEQIDGDTITLKNTVTGETRRTSHANLVASFHQGIVTVKNESGLQRELAKLAPAEIQAIGLRTESEAAIKRMFAIKSWLEALRKAGIENIKDEPWVRTVVRKLKDEELKGVDEFSLRTLAGYARQFDRTGGDWTQLIPNFSQRGGRGKVRTEERVNAIVDDTIEKLKTQQGRIVKTEVYQSVLAQVQSFNLAYPDNPIAPPGAATVSRRINGIFSAYDLCVRRNGKKYADRLYRRNAEAREKAKLPLLIVEFDDLDTGVFTVDERTGLPFGRAYITHGVDQATNCVMGFDIGHEPRSFESAMGAIASCLLPKDMANPMFAECKYAWEPYGHPGQILMDNARYNFSAAIHSQSEQLRLLLSGARAYGPTEKNHIERFNRVCKQDFLHRLPGWRGDKTDPEAVKTGLASAAMTVQDLRRAYTMWVTDIYMRNPRDDGSTPRQHWLDHFQSHSPTVRWSRDQVAAMTLRPDFLRFRASGGLVRLSLRYSSPALYKLREKLGVNAKVAVLTDRSDLSYMMVVDPETKETLRVPCVSPVVAYEGLTEYQHRLILQLARTKGITSPDLQQLVEARIALAKLTAQLARSARLKDRKKAARTGVVAASSTLDHQDELLTLDIDAQARRVITELEYQIEQFTLIEINEEKDMDGWAVA